MAFCAHCGASMADDDKVCGQCGTPVAGENINVTPVAPATPVTPVAPATPVTPVAPVAPAEPTGNGLTAEMKKYIIIGGAALAALLVIIIAAVAVSKATGYKATVAKFVKTIKNEDAAGMVKLASSIDEVYYDSRDIDIEEEFEEGIEMILYRMEDKVGNVKSISYEITDERPYGEKKFERAKDDLEDRYDMDTDSLKKMVEVDFKIVAKGEKKNKVYSDKYTVLLVKEAGGWKISTIYSY